MNPLLKVPIQYPKTEGAGVRSRLVPGTPDDIVDLIEKLLRYSPLERITAKEATKHPFFDELKKPKTVSRGSSKATSASSHKRPRAEPTAQDQSVPTSALEPSRKRRKTNKTEPVFGFVSPSEMK